MLKALSPLAVLLAALALAGPAAAQDPVTDTTPAPVCSGTGETDPGTCTSAGDQQIGDGQVITDPADEVDGPTGPDDGDGPTSDEPKQGEQHGLGEAATSSSPAPAAPRPAALPAPAAPAPRRSPRRGPGAEDAALHGRGRPAARPHGHGADPAELADPPPARSRRPSPLLPLLLQPVQEPALDEDLAFLRREVVRDLELAVVVHDHRDLVGAL